MENLSDREAAAMVVSRIDWKYALHLPLDYAGFDHSVLSEFRGRLVAHEAEGRVFEALLEQLQAEGLVSGRGKQRTCLPPGRRMRWWWGPCGGCLHLWRQPAACTGQHR
jgi:transposase